MVVVTLAARHDSGAGSASHFPPWLFSTWRSGRAYQFLFPARERPTLAEQAERWTRVP